MNKLRQSLRRKKPCYVPEASRPHQWQFDEEAVRKGKCSFPVRYLGHVEVDESRGMHVCEEAVKKLKTIGKKSVKAVLWVSADGLRVVDDKTKDLILDQTIEKVSFCAPDRNYDKAFSYICRDGTTRRWICHCFMALKDSGERLSHAVGCAFAACLERKQKREKECGVTASFDASRTSFVREGSFRVTSTTQQAEREEVMKQLQDRKKESPSLPADSASPPEGAASPVDRTETGYQHAIPRRHAPIEQLVRQGSFRGFPALSQKNSPFKRQLSLRLNELPSTLQRKTDFQVKNPVPEMESGPPDEADSINSLYCQVNSSFSKPPEEPFTSTATTNGTPLPFIPPPPAPARVPAGPAGWAGDAASQSPPACQMGHKRTPSEAERWLEEVAQAVKVQQQQQPQQQLPPTILAALPGTPVSIPNAMQPFPLASTPAPVGMFVPPPVQPAYMPIPTYMSALANSMSFPSVPVVGITPSQMVANVFCTATQTQGSGLAAGKMASIGGHPQSFNAPATVAVVSTSSSNHFSNPITVNGIPPNSQNCTTNGTSNGTAWPPGLKQLAVAGGAQEVDQFEAQWAALESKSQQRASNPFSNELQKTFEIEL
ncbi:protein numb homolog isoform X2 [Polyodon spathula]|uniref:protein numb homolog isoform X2 n=1 Tax=Polyodon spathula TaxID=7913 RepID=UPI001B7E5643|nr:protein numb homolog isoform X2 [Polyodon spathula]